MKHLQVRKIDRRLNMRLVRNGTRWGIGVTVIAAQMAFKHKYGVLPPDNSSVWAVPPGTMILPSGAFHVPGEFVQPADITGERVVTYA